MFKVHFLIFLVLTCTSFSYGQIENIAKKELYNDIWIDEDQVIFDNNPLETFFRTLCSNYDLEFNNEIIKCEDVNIIPKIYRSRKHSIEKREANEDAVEGSGDESPAEPETNADSSPFKTQSLGVQSVPEKANVLEEPQVKEEKVVEEVKVEETPIEPTATENKKDDKETNQTADEDKAPEEVKAEETPIESTATEEKKDNEEANQTPQEENAPKESEPKVEPEEPKVAPEEPKVELTVTESNNPDEEKVSEKSPAESKDEDKPEEPKSEEPKSPEDSIPTEESKPAEEVTAVDDKTILDSKEGSVDAAISLGVNTVKKESEENPENKSQIEPKISPFQKQSLGKAESAPEDTKESVTEENPKQSTPESKPNETSKPENKPAETTVNENPKPDNIDSVSEVSVKVGEEKPGMVPEIKKEENNKEELDSQQSGVAHIKIDGGINETDKKLKGMRSNESIKSTSTDNEEPKSGASEESNEQSGKDNKLLIILFAAVLAVGAAAFAYNYIKKKKSKNAAPVQSNGTASNSDPESGREMKPLMTTSTSQQNTSVDYTDEK